MEQETFQKILGLSDERFRLYLRAGHEPLSPVEIERISRITVQLADLWDTYRRELAAGSRETREGLALQARTASEEVRRALIGDEMPDSSRRAA